MVVHKITRGNLNRGVDFQVEEFKKCLDEDNVILDHIFVTHSGVEGQDKYMLDKVTSLLKDPSIVEITRAGSIVASHCGPGTIGLLYIKRDRNKIKKMECNFAYHLFLFYLLIIFSKEDLK